MTIPFTCPHCGTQTDVFDEFAGHSGPCAICGRTITVPYPSGAAGQGSVINPTTLPESRRRKSWSVWAVAAVIVLSLLIGGSVFLVGVVSLLFPVLSASRQTAMKSRSAGNLRAIYTALRSYEEEFGTLPPAFVPDESGQPQHSWRVLILPYLGYSHVYQRYNFHEPWDSAQNMQLLTLMPREYISPADPDAGTLFETSYMVVDGPQTAFPGSRPSSSADHRDDPSQTILVAETPTCGVAWTQPVDLRTDAMRFIVNGQEGVEIGSRFPDGAHVLTADGGVKFLPNETPPETVQAMTTVAGQEMLPWEGFP